MKIAILLSTYNGEKYIKELFDSLLAQTISAWKLYIRDDGSTDSTEKIINDYATAYPDKIFFEKDSIGNLKSGKSFMQLLKVVEANYYMFCDQDDVWLPFKIEKTLEKLKELEYKKPDMPLAVFTDLFVTDSQLNIINQSMWKYSGINPEDAKDFYKAACVNSATGCTMMLNNELKKKVLPYPNEATMHDRWVSLNAVHYGVIDYVAQPTILYRQHENNVIGAEKTSKNYYISKLLSAKATIIENIKVLKMIGVLNFKVNLLKVVYTKIKIILNK